MRSTNPLPLPAADPAWRIGIVCSSFYKEEMTALTRSAKEALMEAGIPEGNVTVYEAAGSFEVPLIGTAVLSEEKADALIGLGIIVEGDTHHAELLAAQAAHGIMNVQLRFQAPFAFEILYVDALKDAQARLGKGREAAGAVLSSLALLKEIRTKTSRGSWGLR